MVPVRSDSPLGGRAPQSRIFAPTALLTCTFVQPESTAHSRSECGTTSTEDPARFSVCAQRVVGTHGYGRSKRGRMAGVGPEEPDHERSVLRGGAGRF